MSGHALGRSSASAAYESFWSVLLTRSASPNAVAPTAPTPLSPSLRSGPESRAGRCEGASTTTPRTEGPSTPSFATARRPMLSHHRRRCHSRADWERDSVSARRVPSACHHGLQLPKRPVQRKRLAQCRYPLVAKRVLGESAQCRPTGPRWRLSGRRMREGEITTHRSFTQLVLNRRNHDSTRPSAPSSP